MQWNREKVLIILAFAAIYFIWGSTFLVNWYAIQDIPPFLMSSARFFVAGLLLYLVMRLLGAARPTRKHWWHALLSGILFLTIGTGGVVWAEQYLDSSMAALLIGAEPLVILILMWQLQSKRPKWNGALGVSLGIIGMYLLVGQPKIIADREHVIGLIAILISMLSWGVVAVKINDFHLPESRILASAMQMIGGGLMLFLMSLFSGELNTFDPAGITTRGFLSVLYLIFFGSIVAFSAFNFLLTKVSPDKVATSNYVNPIVALLLGWGLNNEEITPQSLIAASLLIFSVFLVNSKWKTKRLSRMKPRVSK